MGADAWDAMPADGEAGRYLYVTSALLLNISLLTKGVRRQFEDGADITASQYRVLSGISRLGDSPHVGDLSRLLSVTVPSASESVARLDARGLVACERDEADRRRMTVRLTGRGRASLDQSGKRLERYFKGLWRPLGREHVGANVRGAFSLDDKHKPGATRDGVRFIQLYLEVPFMTAEVLERAARESGLSVGEYRVLLELSDNDGALSNKDLGMNLLMRPSVLAETMRALSDKACVSREEVVGRHGPIGWSLMAEGAEALARASARVNHAMTNDTYAVTPDDQDLFNEEAELICRMARATGA